MNLKTCIPVADSWWYMAKPIQYCKVKKKKEVDVKMEWNVQEFYWEGEVPVWKESDGKC